MNYFNTLYKQLIEGNTSAGVLGVPSTSGSRYAEGDNRPITPAQIAIGAKIKKKKNKNEPNQQMVEVPLQRRPKVETIFLKGK